MISVWLGAPKRADSPRFDTLAGDAGPGFGRASHATKNRALALAHIAAPDARLWNGQPFEERNLIVFLAFCVIFVTLVLQGLTLPALIRGLGLAGTEEMDPEETEARKIVLKSAIRYLEEVREEFSRRNVSYDTALVNLELAALHAREGRPKEVKALAWETLSIFQAQDVPREAVAALAFFVQAAERETLTAELADQLVAFLRLARYTPGLWFAEARSAEKGGEIEGEDAGPAR